MKKLFLLFALVSLLASCVEKIEDGGNTKTIEVSYDAIRPLTEMTVEAKEGYITHVIQSADTLASLTQTTRILVPRSQKSTANRAAEDIKISYESMSSTSTTNGDTMKNLYVLMFEDSKGNNDNDYNDVIIHVRQTLNKLKTGVEMKIELQPVAMGNTRKMGFGCDVYILDANNNLVKSAEFIFTNDIKVDYFKVNDVLKMINTYSYGRPLNGYPTLSTKIVSGKDLITGAEYSALNYRANGTGFLPQTIESTDIIYINWFIQNDKGEKCYTVPSYKSDTLDWLSEAGYPIGLLISDISEAIYKDSEGTACGKDWINYPSEGVNIEKVFPGFTSWLQGTSVAPDFTKPVDGTYIDAITNYGGVSLYDMKYFK
ncbi:MAG: DUF4114 domain-containing protein [Muribaculaceae bacterium]|nr:DUF4114 domain-containing protein [Muribaculaceae bacterium]